ncbi:MAG: hypothetical protein FD170_1129 [Bacteroidetes bacterium]|nr:MAG: hypothetical protein FD170_1129 [Bacteroidota bacterium]
MKIKLLTFFLSISILSNAQTFLDSVRAGTITMDKYAQEFNKLDDFNDIIIPFKENDKWGYKDNNTNIIIEPKYDYASKFQNDLAIVKQNDKNGLINKYDKIIIPFGKYDAIYSFKDKRARVKVNNLFGIIDDKGNEILPCVYKSTDNYRFGLCQLTDKNNNQGLVDLNGNIIIPFVYEKLIQMQLSGVIKAKKDGKYGYINYKNDILIKFKYDYIDQPSNGMIAVKNGDKYGFINTIGEEIIPCIYDKVYPFTENGNASVIKNGKAGYVLENGNEIIIE